MHLSQFTIDRLRGAAKFYPTVREWYGILRQYHHFSVLQAIQYALYLRGWIN